jgi:hypothetical protein
MSAPRRGVRESELKREVLALVVAVLVVGSLGGYYFYQTSGHPNTGIARTTYTASNPNLGIRLTISLNATTIRIGGTINYSASVYNTRPSQNNVSSASNWAIPRLISTACGTSPTDSPIAYAIMRGHYESGNISKAPSINSGMMCTTVMGGVKVYSFQPTSDVASVIGDCNPNPCFTRPVSTWRPFSQYPGGGGPEPWANFTTGVYTVVAEDEWGDLAMASFTVA